MHQRPITRLAAAVVAAAFLLGACSSGGDDEAETDTTVTTVGEQTGDEGTDEGEDGEDESPDGTDGGDEGDSGDGGNEGGGNGGGDAGDAPDLSGDARSYAEAFAASMKNDPEFPLEDSHADCFAGRTINTIGADRLRAAGVEPADLADPDSDTPFDFSDAGLNEDDAARLYGHFGECGIDIREAMLQGMADDPDTSPAMQACFEGALTEDIIRTLMISSFMHGGEMDPEDPAMGQVMGALMGCAFLGMEGMDGMGG